jgi:hypothetical protein
MTEPLVIDIYYGDQVQDFARTKAFGIVGVIHKASEATGFSNKLYETHGPFLSGGCESTESRPLPAPPSKKTAAREHQARKPRASDRTRNAGRTARDVYVIACQILLIKRKRL